MANKDRAKKSVKRKPTKSLKEKRMAKREKRDGRTPTPGGI